MLKLKRLFSKGEDVLLFVFPPALQVLLIEHSSKRVKVIILKALTLNLFSNVIVLKLYFQSVIRT